MNSSHVLKDVQDVVGQFFGEEHRNTFKRLESSVRWHSQRKAIGRMTSEVESLKIDLTVMLQMHQIQNSETRALLAAERTK